MKYLNYNMALNSFRIAQTIAPFLSGNLRHNAMFLLMTPTGFEIVYDDQFAHYIDFLEIPGLGSSDIHALFIEMDTFWSVVSYLESMINPITPNRASYQNHILTEVLDRTMYDSMMQQGNMVQREANRTVSIAISKGGQA